MSYNVRRSYGSPTANDASHPTERRLVHTVQQSRIGTRSARSLFYVATGATALVIATLPVQLIHADDDITSQHPTIKAKLPPGVFLDEDGKPCKVCNSWKSYAKATKKKKTAAKSAGGVKDGDSVKRVGSDDTVAAVAAVAIPVTVLSSTTFSSEEDDVSERPKDCPPDVEELGRSTWTFLHTTAAYYPIEPTTTQQEQMLGLIKGLAAFYPCSYCATEFRQSIKENPPDVSGREGLSRWVCDRHNEVNVRLGKEVFDCDKVLERWKEGWKDGRCD